MSPRSSRRGFTLMELLVVIGVIAGLTFFLVRGVNQGKGAALQSGQALISNLLIAARTQAVSSGQGARILIQNDPTSVDASRRYLRYVVLQVSDGTNWITVSDAYLPDGVAVLPRDLTNPSNLVNSEKLWTRPSDGAALRSTSLRTTSEYTLAVNSNTAEQWTAVAISASGATGNSGDLILGSVKMFPPDATVAGMSPIQFEDPETVRGVSIGTYGVAVLVNGRQGF
ncbi:pilus assembly FimT family protein [Oleiharenicola lentus]|uniref:pilus assembly FimT family protein n=1 Tax=Oleiharenicola lentus TaxID=2508720 RepID=UPI003F66704E